MSHYFLFPARKKVSHEETYVSFDKSIGLAGPLSLPRFSSAALRGKVYYSRDKYRPLNYVRRRSETARRTERTLQHRANRKARVITTCFNGKERRKSRGSILVTAFFTSSRSSFAKSKSICACQDLNFILPLKCCPFPILTKWNRN